MKTVTYKLGYGQQSLVNYPKKTRSLLSNLQDAKERQDKHAMLSTLSDLGDLFLETEDWAQVIKFSKQAIELAKTLPDKTDKNVGLKCTSEALYKLGNACREIQEYDAALQYQNEYYMISQKLNSKMDILQALFDLGVTFLSRGESEQKLSSDFQSAYSHLKNAAKQLTCTDFDATDKDLFKAQIYMNLGITLKQIGDNDKAIDFINYSLPIYIRAGDKIQEANAYCNLAVCYEHKNMISKAVEYNMLELRVYEKIQDSIGTLKSLWDLALRLTKTRNYSSAKKTYEKYAQVCLEIHDMEEASLAHEAIKRLDVIVAKVAEITHLDLLIVNDVKNRDLRSEFTHRGLRASNHLIVGNCEKAIQDFEWQRQTSLTLQLNPQQVYTILGQLGDAYLANGRYTDALTTFKDLLKNPFLLLNENINQRLVLYSKMGEAMKLCDVPFNQMNRHLMEYLESAQKHESNENQRDALLQLLDLNKKYNYTDKIRVYEAQLSRVDGLLATGSGIQENSIPFSENSLYDSDVQSPIASRLIPPSTNTLQSTLQPTFKLNKPSNKVNKSTNNGKNKMKKRLEIQNIVDSPSDESDSTPSHHSNDSIKTRRKRQLQSIQANRKKLQVISSSPSSHVPSSSFTQSTSVDEIPNKSRINPKVKPKKRIISSQLEDVEEEDLQDVQDVQEVKGKDKVIELDDSSDDKELPPFPNLDIQFPPSIEQSIEESMEQSMEHIHQDLNVYNDHIHVDSFHMDVIDPPPILSTHTTPKTSPTHHTLKLNSHTTPKATPTHNNKTFKVRVTVQNPENQSEIFAIPCSTGPSGTPKTIRWLLDETTRRYKDLYQKTPFISKLIYLDPDTNENETLFEKDLIQDVVENKQKVTAIMKI